MEKKNYPFERTIMSIGPAFGYKYFFNEHIHAEALMGAGLMFKHSGGSELGDLFFPRAGLLLGYRI